METYKRDGSFPARLEFGKQLGNHSLRPDLAQRTSARLQQLANPNVIAAAPPPAWKGMPTTGTNRIPVFLIEFPDHPHVNAAADIEGKLFGDGEPLYFPRESLRNYYRRSSYHQLELEGNVLGWYLMQHERDWYRTNGGTTTAITEVIQHFDPSHDFSQYDLDGDGQVNYIAVLWSGPHTGWGSFWWGYFSHLPAGIVADGVEFTDYSWQWESSPVGVNFSPHTLIHETGHALGLPDYYDYDDNIGPRGGVGGLDMMAGDYADHNVFSKFILDWLTPTVVAAGTTNITLRASGVYPDALLIMAGASVSSYFDEFFMVENRLRLNNDADNPGNGMLIWHIDAHLGGINYRYDNSYTDHKLLRLMEADGLEQIEQGWSADSGDYYNQGEVFTPYATPNSRQYNGADSGVAVYNISADGISMTATAAIESPTNLCAPIIFEAENATLVAPMIASNDTAAWFSQCIRSTANNSGTAAWTVSVPVAGPYILWCRVLAPSTSSDSFFVTVNGQEDIFDVTHTPSPNWQWTRLNGRNGGAAWTLDPRLLMLNAGSNSLIIRNRETGVRLDRLIVTCNTNYLPSDAPIVTASPQNLGINCSNPATFSVTAAGPMPRLYRWKKGQTFLNDDGRISGSTTPMLTFSPVLPGDAGDYHVVVSNAFGSATSSNANLFVYCESAIAIFDDPTYVDTSGGIGAESDNLQAALANRRAITFTNITTVVTNYPDVADLLFPEFEIRSLTPDLTPGQRTALTNFVFQGGRILVHGGATLHAAAFLNAVFGFSLQESNSPSGNNHYRTRDARWTPFNEDAPSVLADNVSISALQASTLPFNAVSFYTNGPLSSLVFFSWGNGLVIFLGWDWHDAQPVGSQDGGWNEAFHSTIWQRRLPPPFFERSLFSRTVPIGSTAKFHVSANGLGPISYYWRKNGIPITNAITDTLILSNVQPADAGAYAIAISNYFAGQISDFASLIVTPSFPLPTALNASALTWTTGGASEWFGQTNITHEEESWLETSVVGPGTLSFWWSISSEFTYDYLEFLTNGTRAALISGEVPWENQTYELGPGNQLLRWRYQKDSSDSNGQDTAWLDEVTFTAASVPFAVQAERSAENVRLSWPVHPQKNYSVVFKNDLTDATWQTLTQQIAISNGTATVTDSLLARPHRFYRVIEE